MKKFYFLALTFVILGFCKGQASWVAFSSPDPQQPRVTLQASDNSNVVFEVETFGMYSTEITEQGDTYQRLQIPGCSSTTDTGAPEIPYVRKLIAIPKCDQVSLSVTVNDQSTLSNYYVYPAPEYVEQQSGELVWLEEQFYIDTTAYADTANIPNLYAEIKTIGYLRDQRFAEVWVYPVQFDPANEQLQINNVCTVTLNFTNPSTSINANTGLFNNVATNSFLNYTSSGITASVSSNPEYPGNISWISFTDTAQAANITADYLIITDELFYDAQDPNAVLLEIARHRADYNGFDVAVVKVEEILASDFHDPGEPYHLEEAMRRFIKRVYEGANANHTYDGKLAYVLLVGDAYYGTDFGVPTSYKTLQAGTNPPNVINDYYFSCLTEDNGIADDIGDLFIGRFSVRSMEQLSNIISKTKYCEREADLEGWRDTVYFANSDGLNGNDTLVYAHLLEKINAMDSLYIPEPYQNKVFNEYDYTISDTMDRYGFLQKLNSGCLFLSYYGHGLIEGYAVGKGDPLGYYADTAFLKTKLSNKGRYPFALNYTCWTGRFASGISGNCFSEIMLNYSDTAGFVGIIGSVEPIYISQNTMTYPPDNLKNGYMEYSIYNELSHIAGEFILQSRLSSYGAWLLNYFGDPALNIMAEGFEITQDLTFNEDVIISTKVTLRSGNTLALNACDLYFVDNGELIIEDGATFSIGNNRIWGQNTANKMIVRGNFVQNGSEPSNITLTSPLGSEWSGLIFDNNLKDYQLKNVTMERCGISGNAHSLSIDQGSFDNAYLEFSIGKLEVEDCDFDESYIYAYNGELVMPVNIIDCNFDNTQIFDYPIKIDDYKLYSIHGNTIRHNDKTGIAIYNSRGSKGAEIHQIYSNTIYSKTFGSGNTDFGIRVYNSSADIVDDNYIYGNYVGLVSYNASEVDLLGDCSAENESAAQRIKNNSLRQVYTDENSFPTTFQYNVVNDDNASTYYVYHERRGTPPSPDTDISDNYWGNSFDPDDNLYPDSCFIYEPYWEFGCDKSGTVETQYDSAVAYVKNGEYQLAENKFRDIILNHPGSKYAKASVKELFSLQELYDRDYAGLKAFYDTAAVLQDSTAIGRLADWLSNKCDVKMGNYQQAVSWYENIIDNPETENDSVFAIIDLGYTYLLMEDSAQRQHIICRYPRYNIRSRTAYAQYRDELLEGLWEDAVNTGIQENDPLCDQPFGDIFIYPNPASGSFSIKFVCKEEILMGLSIYDHTGRLVSGLAQKAYPKGENMISIEVVELPDGIYHCIFKTNRGLQTKKIVKL